MTELGSKGAAFIAEVGTTGGQKESGGVAREYQKRRLALNYEGSKQKNNHHEATAETDSQNYK